MSSDKITREDLIEEIHVDLDNLDTVRKGLRPDGSKFPIDIKKQCIFRGVSNIKHELTPKALRTSDDGEFEICKYIPHNLNEEYHSAIFEGIGCDGKELTFDLQQRREFFILFRFLDLADKSGLNVPVEREVRKLLHSNINCLESHWPQSRFYEIIALAQHKGLPTCALDWSYDYKVALYFAVKKVLENDSNDCVLWALNYKPLEKESEYVIKTGIDDENRPQLRFYRPQYPHNDNIKAQKGLFTFLINKEKTFNLNIIKTLDEFICNTVKENATKNNNSEIEVDLKGIENFTLKNNEKILYKFTIDSNCKKRILKELYTDGYSEEYLFPGYSGVADTMKNWVALQNIKNKRIMFISNKNTCRSVIAKELFKKYDKTNNEVYSSGINVKNGKVSKYVIKLLNEHEEIDVSTYKPMHFKNPKIKDMDLVFTFENHHKEKILKHHPELEVYSLDIKEPYGNIKSYEKCYNEIFHKIKKIKEKLEQNTA